MLALRKSMSIALNIGLTEWAHIFEQLKYYVEAKIFTENNDLASYLLIMQLRSLNLALSPIPIAWSD